MWKSLKQITGSTIFTYKGGNRNYWIIAVQEGKAVISWSLYTECFDDNASHTHPAWGGISYRFVHSGEFDRPLGFDYLTLELILKEINCTFFELAMGMAQSARMLPLS